MPAPQPNKVQPLVLFYRPWLSCQMHLLTYFVVIRQSIYFKKTLRQLHLITLVYVIRGICPASQGKKVSG